MKKHLVFSVCFFVLILLGIARAQVLTLQPLASFGPNGNGSMLPGQTNGSTTVDFGDGGANRAIAYNPTTGHLLFVARTNTFDPFDFHVYVLDGNTGTNILVVTTNSDNSTTTNVLELDVSSFVVTGGNASFTYNMIGIADDGTILVGNLSNAASPPQYRLYCWTSETAAENCVYGGDPGNGDQSTLDRRWGDAMAVRGSGQNIQVLLASRGTPFSIISPPSSGGVDESFSWTSTALQSDVPASVGIGFGLCFGPGNTFYSKAASSSPGNPLVRLSFDLNAGTATTLQTYSLTNFPGRICAMNTLLVSNIMVGVDVVAGNDYVRLYDISNPALPPVELDRQQFTTNVNNALFAGSVAFSTNGIVYALDTDNGLRAFTLVSVPTNALPPSFILQPVNTTIFPNQSGVLPTNASFTAVADGTPLVTYQWFKGTSLLTNETNITLNVPNPQLADNATTFSIVATNDYGSVTSTIVTLGVITNIPVVLPYYEPFNEPVGVLGTNGGWYVQSGASGNIQAGNLNVPGLAASSGNMFSWLNGTMSDRLPFGIYSSGTLYYSIALQVTDLSGLNNGVTGGTPGVLCGLANGTGTTFFKLDIRTNNVPGQYNLGLAIGGAAVIYATNIFNVGDTVFAVASYTFSGAANGDIGNLWLNPSPSNFGSADAPTPDVTQTATSGNIAALDRFFFRHSGANQPSGILADELRIGLAWAEVTEPTVPQLQISAHGTNATISWLAPSTGFVLQGTTSLKPAQWADVTNQATVMGTNNVVTINMRTNEARFFRLLK